MATTTNEEIQGMRRMPEKTPRKRTMEFKAMARASPPINCSPTFPATQRRVTVNEFQKKGELQSLLKFCKPMNFQELLMGL